MFPRPLFPFLLWLTNFCRDFDWKFLQDQIFARVANKVCKNWLQSAQSHLKCSNILKTYEAEFIDYKLT